MAGDLLVVAHGGSQQFHAGTHPGAGKGTQVIFRLSGSNGLEVHHQPEFVTVPHLVIAMQVAVHERCGGRRGEHGVGPVAPAQDRLVLIWPGPPPEPVAQDPGRGRRELGAGELADGGLGALARRRMVQCRQEACQLPGARSRSIESMTSNREAPGTRLVMPEERSGLMLLATTSGRNGTCASRASAARTPISRARRSAAGRDQANFMMNRSPATVLPD